MEPQPDPTAQANHLVRLLAGLTILACIGGMPFLIALGAPQDWLMGTGVLLPAAGASLWLVHRGHGPLAAAVLLLSCDAALLAFHLRVGPSAHLTLPAILMVVATFRLFIGASHREFMAALGLQTAVLLVVVLVPGQVIQDPALAQHTERLSVLTTVFSFPLLVVTMHQLRELLVAARDRADHTRDRWEQLMASAPIGVVVTGAGHRIEATNRPEQEGLRVGQRLTDCLGGHDPGRLFAHLARGGDEPTWIVLSGCGPDRDRSLRVSAQPLLDGRCLVSLDDVTHRRSQSAALRNAQEEVALAARSRTRLIGRLAHELRTPLTLVLGHAELLREDGDREPGETRSSLDEIHAGARQLQRRIDALLQAAQARDGVVELEPREVDLARLCAEVLHEWEGPASRADIALHAGPDPSLGPVRADPAPVRRILWHLLSNAIRFSPAGRVVLSARREGGELLIAVEDDGVGIPLQLQARVLMPATEESPQGEGGVGLGLAASRQWARRLGGDLRLETSAGGGTVATLSLPFDSGEEVTHSPAPGSRSEPRRALVVDDLALNAELAAALLEEKGIEAVAMTDPEQALKTLQDDSFNLVLIDCHMPVLNGYDLASAVSGQPGPNASTPLVALTMDETQDCERRCRESGFVRRLLKPLTPADVDELLTSALDPLGNSPRVRKADHLLESLRQEFGETEFVGQLIATWIASTDGHLRDLTAAAANQDRVAVEQLAHTISSPAQTLGAHQLGTLALDLERLAPFAPWPETAVLIDQVIDETRSVRSRLQRLMEEAA